MRKPVAVLLLLGAILALSEGCAPIPLPHYAAYRSAGLWIRGNYGPSAEVSASRATHSS